MKERKEAERAFWGLPVGGTITQIAADLAFAGPFPLLLRESNQLESDEKLVGFKEKKGHSAFVLLISHVSFQYPFTLRSTILEIIIKTEY